MDISQMEKIIAKPTWKEILTEQIKTKKLDPWNVDIIKLSSAFLEEVKKMEEMNLYVPANIILASAILLKYKSEILVQKPEPQVLEYSEPLSIPSFPELNLSPRLPPKIPITLNEIIEEIEKVIKYDSKSVAKKRKKYELKTYEIKIEGVDMDKEIKKTLDRIKQTIDSEGWTRFSYLLKEKTKKEVILNLLSLLHLYKEEEIILKQEKIFGEIFIKLVPSSSGQG